MGDYTYDLIVATIANMERIRSFLERTTSELFPLYYQIEIPEGYKSSEGHTLEDLSPHTTRVPKKESLKETLLMIVVDVERALSMLDPLERLEVVLSLDENLTKKKDNKIPDLRASTRELIEKMVIYLNGNF